MTSELAVHWTLDPSIDFLNHGSFGACPRVVLEAQQELRTRLEREPVLFMVRELEPLLDATRTALAEFVHAAPEDLVFVANATTGVNTVVRSLEFAPGDEILTTDHAYGACRNALADVARRTGARVVVAAVPFPLQDARQVVDAVLGAAGPRTRLALLDQVTSPTGLVFPVEQLVPQLAVRGIETLVDGAHAPGMVPVDLEALGAAYYTANCHKWLCGPKSAAFLWVRRDRQPAIHPLVVSHGATSPRRERSRFLLEFDWMGTTDPTPILAVPMALSVVAGLVPGGWPEVRRRNRALALAGRRMLCDALHVALPAPDDMIGSIASVPLPDGDPDAPRLAQWTDPLQAPLFEKHRIEVPVFQWPAAPHRLVRIAAQLYNTPAQFERLATTLAALLPSGASR
jgi:isopenicillin-N epimerase